MNSADQASATSDHCVYCFDVLKGALNKEFSEKSFPPLPSSIPKISAPLFVTWHINGDDLRGCIGTFASESIEKNLPKYTLISAFQDSRFDPISKSELPQLSVAVSLLTNFEKAKDCYDWEVGRHGITIEFEHKNRFYRGTFLPEVAKEQEWTKEETLKHLIRKAGYSGKLQDVEKLIELERYQSSKAEVSYKEYIKIKGN